MNIDAILLAIAEKRKWDAVIENIQEKLLQINKETRELTVTLDKSRRELKKLKDIIQTAEIGQRNLSGWEMLKGVK